MRAWSNVKTQEKNVILSLLYTHNRLNCLALAFSKKKNKVRTLALEMALFADDISARVGYNTTLFSCVVTTLQPCDRILTQCDKIKIQQYTCKRTKKWCLLQHGSFSFVKTC